MMQNDVTGPMVKPLPTLLCVWLTYPDIPILTLNNLTPRVIIYRYDNDEPLGAPTNISGDPV